jgi:hypothetical protein
MPPHYPTRDIIISLSPCPSCRRPHHGQQLPSTLLPTSVVLPHYQQTVFPARSNVASHSSLPNSSCHPATTPLQTSHHLFPINALDWHLAFLHPPLGRNNNPQLPHPQTPLDPQRKKASPLLQRWHSTHHFPHRYILPHPQHCSTRFQRPHSCIRRPKKRYIDLCWRYPLNLTFGNDNPVGMQCNSHENSRLRCSSSCPTGLMRWPNIGAAKAKMDGSHWRLLSVWHNAHRRCA